jgi:hypothetical protein
MILEKNLFNSVETLEPKCPKCEIIIDYGENTTYNDKKECHVCNECGTKLE